MIPKEKKFKNKKENEREPQMSQDQEGNWKGIQGHTQRQALRGVETERKTESV